MKEISITGKKLPYGISLNDIFWRREGIITANNIRQSRDDLLQFLVGIDEITETNPAKRGFDVVRIWRL